MMLRGSVFFILHCLFIALFFLPGETQAQRTDIYENDIRYYNRALELFNKEKYGVAQKHFLLYAERTRDRETRINAEYYAGVCAMELFNPDAINLLGKVAIRYPDHSKAALALFNLGKYFYRIKDNKLAVQYLSGVNPIALTPEEASEFWFMKGYCYFKLEQFEESKTAFKNIKDQGRQIPRCSKLLLWLRGIPPGQL